MKQEFRRYQFVRVVKEAQGYKSNFGDFDAIISGSYSDHYGGQSIDSYVVYQVENGKVVDLRSWYDDWQIKLLPDQDIDKAGDMIEAYNLKF